MSTTGGGTVDYRAPVLEVSGDGIETCRLDTPGDDIDITLGDGGPQDGTDRRSKAPHDTSRPMDAPEEGSDPTSTTNAGQPGSPPRGPNLLEGLLAGLPHLGELGAGAPLPLPAVPGLPQVGGDPESARVTGPGTHLHISLGDVRQATSGHAIAAKATAIKIAITQGRSDSRTKHGYGGQGGVILDLDLGVLQAAAVAPEPSGGVEGVMAGGGGGGGLPVTGPRVDVIALIGIALLAGGAGALAFGLRRARV
jgi:hypothetical protein